MYLQVGYRVSLSLSCPVIYCNKASTRSSERLMKIKDNFMLRPDLTLVWTLFCVWWSTKHFNSGRLGGGLCKRYVSMCGLPIPFSNIFSTIDNQVLAVFTYCKPKLLFLFPTPDNQSILKRPNCTKQPNFK